MDRMVGHGIICPYIRLFLRSSRILVLAWYVNYPGDGFVTIVMCRIGGLGET
jgi:hypothetical protein